MSHETKLNGSELLYQLMNNITDHIYFKDKDSRFILVNKSMASKFDLTPEEVLGKTDFDLFALEHARPAFMAEQQMIRTAQPIISLEEKEIWSDGRETWVSTTKMLLRDDSGAVIGTFGISRDITQHKLNEIELHQYSRRLKQINKQMEDEIHMAANLQQVFLPKSYPSFSAASGAAAVEFFHRSIASAQVSGDLCSVKKLSDSSVGLLICDVMGHGIRSALVTAIVHTLLVDLMKSNRQPHEVLSEMNRQLLPVLQSEDTFIFVTASYLILNTQTGVLTGSSAGHKIPFLVHRHGSPRVALLQEIMQVNGPALAVMENYEYQTMTTQLQPGDTLLLYTDGLVEEVNEKKEEFGEHRVQTVLEQMDGNHPQQVCHRLVEALTEYERGLQFDDDVCLLACRWNEPSI